MFLVDLFLKGSLSSLNYQTTSTRRLTFLVWNSDKFQRRTVALGIPPSLIQTPFFEVVLSVRSINIIKNLKILRLAKSYFLKEAFSIFSLRRHLTLIKF